MWLACRHHVGEVISIHVWDGLNIVSKDPEIQIFERSKAYFESLPHEDSLKFVMLPVPKTLKKEKTEISLVQNAPKTDFSIKVIMRSFFS